MKFDYKNLSSRWIFLSIVVTSFLSIAASVFFFINGCFIIFQNIFYIPLILACFYYGKRGYAFSIFLVLVYFSLVVIFTDYTTVIGGAAIRVGFFLIIASIIVTISLMNSRTKYKLIKERESFQTVADFTYDWAYWTDPKQNLIYVSPSCQRICGHNPEKFFADPSLMSKIVHPGDRDQFRRHMTDYHDKCINTVGEFEFRILNKYGEDRWISHLCQPVFGNDGKFMGRRANNRDITDRKNAEEALIKSEENLRRERDWAQNYLDVAATMLIVIGRDAKIKLINRKGCEILGYREDEIVGEDWFDKCLPPGFLTDARALYRRLMAGEVLSNTELENKVLDSKGRERLIAWRNSLLHDDKGQITGVLASGNDITEKKQMELDLWESEQRYRAFFETSRDGTFMTGVDGRWIEFNPAMVNLLGYNSEEELKAVNINNFYKNIEDRGRLEALLMESGYVHDYPIDIIGKDGNIVHALVTSVIRRGPTGNIIGYQGVVNDITERKRSEEAIHWLAYHDSLTGLPNRALFNDRADLSISQALREEKPLAIMIFDLDKFKDVNDTLGHNVGDLLLKSVSERMSHLIRKGDTVARMGGDEFLLIFPTIKRDEDVILIASKIIETFQTPFLCNAHELKVTTSLGISIYPKDGEDVDTLVKRADIAMYKAKQTGRNRYELYQG